MLQKLANFLQIFASFCKVQRTILFYLWERLERWQTSKVREDVSMQQSTDLESYYLQIISLSRSLSIHDVAVSAHGYWEVVLFLAVVRLSRD